MVTVAFSVILYYHVAINIDCNLQSEKAQEMSYNG